MDLILVIVSLAALAAYVCRLDALHWSQHKASFIVLHIAGASSCAWVLTQAAAGNGTIGCGLSLGMSVAWLWVSFWSWRDGVPKHAWRDSRQPT